MRKCNFDNLPKTKVKKNGSFEEKINWGNSIGCKIPFVYDDIEGDFIIVGYNPKEQKLTIEYLNKENTIATSQLLLGRLGGVVGKFNRDYIYELEQILTHNGEAIVIERFKKGKDNIRHYLLKCLDCGGTYDRSEGHIKNRGVKCPKCGDGISYPNNFMYAVLKQLDCNFKTEYEIIGVENKRYDFYIDAINTVIEVHGGQHYLDTGLGKKGGRTLEQEQENDKIKKEMALNKGYNYIEIDARKSEMSWLKTSIKNSILQDLYNLDKVDWEECHILAVKNFTKEVCLRFEEGDSEITKKIAEEYGVNRSTIVKHLKRGTELGWCNYDSNIIQTLNGSKLSKNKKRAIICIETGQEFESASECARLSLEVFSVKMSQSKISEVCNGMAKSCKGYSFKYKDGDGLDMSQFLKNKKALDICLAKQENNELSTKELAKMFNVNKDCVVGYLKKREFIRLVPL